MPDPIYCKITKILMTGEGEVCIVFTKDKDSIPLEVIARDLKQWEGRDVILNVSELKRNI